MITILYFIIKIWTDIYLPPNMLLLAIIADLLLALTYKEVRR